MKKSRTFRLNDNTMEQLEAIKRAYNQVQNEKKSSELNVKSFSTATVLERLIEREYFLISKGDD